MDVSEMEKALKSIGADLVSTREELKALKDSPRADPKELKTMRDELDDFKKGWDELMTKLKDPEKPPEPAPKPTPDPTGGSGTLARGFGFFHFK